MVLIKKLDKFIAKQFCLLFLGTFFICQFVLMMQFLFIRIDQLIGKGLSMEVLAQFFWYMGLMLVPQALPLAILLSSLITFGNLGESSELTAIKAAGISLMQAFRSLIILVVFIAIGSFCFQDIIGPNANMKMAQLLMSMKQKNPELEIPEGIFYDGIPNSNLYVQKKDISTGKLYGVMIYRMNGSYEDAAIILADSGMLQSTAEKKHLVLTLYNGEWFENMQSQALTSGAAVPYRRETFVNKKIILDFDADFNLNDASSLSNNAKSKSLSKIRHDMDSLKQYYDSIGRNYYSDMKRSCYAPTMAAKPDSMRAVRMALSKATNFDSIFSRAEAEVKLSAVNEALHTVQNKQSDLDFKAMMTSDGDKLIRQHQIEAINKFTQALSCILFFFIGAPLGAIIRKGGLGVPVIVSVLVFIVYYIFFNTGYRMARGGMWAVWFGMALPVAVLTPMSIFFTYKATNDSMVFNMDLYRNIFMRMFGLRMKRGIYRKDVIINDPDYAGDAVQIEQMNDTIDRYIKEHNLVLAPNIIKVFFKYAPDNEMEELSERLENVIEDLSNTRDRHILSSLNMYPIMTVKAHTRPFSNRWLNVLSAILVPVGLFFYFRMWRFRLRLLRDLRIIRQTNTTVLGRIERMKTPAQQQ